MLESIIGWTKRLSRFFVRFHFFRRPDIFGFDWKGIEERKREREREREKRNGRIQREKMSVEDAINYKPSEEEDYYALLSCDESSTVSSRRNWLIASSNFFSRLCTVGRSLIRVVDFIFII